MSGTTPEPDTNVPPGPSGPVEEPVLGPRVPRMRTRRRRLVRALPFLMALVLAGAGLHQLRHAGKLLLPFESVTTLRGRLASVGDLFKDPQIVRILRKNGLKVEITSAGSREVATGSLNGLDFVFPSGQPAADLIYVRRQEEGLYSKDFHPFDSPLVLATFAPYAKALTAIHAAEPEKVPAGPQLYYTVDMARFLALRNTKWNSLDVQKYGFRNDNKILAQTSDICESNSADSYLSLAAFTLNNDSVLSKQTVPSLAPAMKQVFGGQGAPSDGLYSSYVSSNGSRQSPVAVLYEHQFLTYQTAYRAAHGHVDTQRVLLYPKTQLLSEPHYIALNHQADRLGELLEGDPELLRRETELGYQLHSSEDGHELRDYLRSQGVPAPQEDTVDRTKVTLPDLSVLEAMITKIKGRPCPAHVPGHTTSPSEGR
ncbi:hypothetical protein ACFY2V_18500 [Streptomyces eurythermus]|uniref:hypothetical protein n=1 Tax=Streptomyces eurythermus TaxID=42237 RepID=UPI0036736496